MECEARVAQGRRGFGRGAGPPEPEATRRHMCAENFRFWGEESPWTWCGRVERMRCAVLER